MTISYNWLSEYLPLTVEPERLGKILTSLGLEVENLERYEEVKGGLRGLVIGEVIACEQHPNADKLKLTRVNTGDAAPLQIVCGAPNVAIGQKVVVATVGTTIYPKNGEALTMKVAKIRGVESYGMICAEDEIGLSDNHEGIMVLPDNVQPGTPAANYFHPYSDWVFEIGLTPNRMDAMSHLGVARDVCAYLSHHDKKDYRVKTPSTGGFKPASNKSTVTVSIENNEACRRYSGISLTGVEIKESPLWLRQKLKAIGLRPISNIVDITNYVLHETGQPLHAFDADAIRGNRVIVKKLPAGTSFTTLDGKERKLAADDLMICNAEEPMCIAGVYGGLHSGVTAATKNIFLESAWFNPVDIRKTSFRHDLRTDAAVHFEKNVDISNTVNVLKRAALLIRDLAGATIASDITDTYPLPEEKGSVQLKFHYLKKLSGKNYHPDTVRNILGGLGFEVVKEGMDDLWVAPPYNKPDVRLAADVVEEIMRIDGYDNIEIPSSITITPSVDAEGYRHTYQEKAANYLAGLGFSEILTNSITSAAFYSEEELSTAVKMLNSLSAELNIMRPSMLETGLQSIAHNLNRKNNNLRFFEFGKIYSTSGSGQYHEQEQLSLLVTGQLGNDSWKGRAAASDFYYAKGVLQNLLSLLAPGNTGIQSFMHPKLDQCLQVSVEDAPIAIVGRANNEVLARFDIKQPVWYAALDWQKVLELSRKSAVAAAELPRQLPVQRDLAMVLPRTTPYGEVEKVIRRTGVEKLRSVQLFDIFESEKLGAGKKSMAVNFQFLDEEKTLTDREIDAMMGKIMKALETGLQAEIRK